MKIAIIGAMEEEVTILRNKLAHSQTEQKAGCEIYTGELAGHTVALLKSGIGKVAAALSTTLLLDHFDADIVINTGSAGGIAPHLSMGDIVISDEVGYHDADLTGFGYAPGQLPGCPATFTADATHLKLALSCAKKLDLNALTGLICSGDIFVNDDARVKDIQTTFPAAIAVEMEAAAIAHVCYRFNVPFIVVRAISDVADKQSHLSFDEFLPIAAKQSSALVESMLHHMPA